MIQKLEDSLIKDDSGDGGDIRFNGAKSTDFVREIAASNGEMPS